MNSSLDPTISVFLSYPVHCTGGLRPFLVEKRSSPPYFSGKKHVATFFSKPALNAAIKTTLCTYCMYHTPMNTPESLDPTLIAL